MKRESILVLAVLFGLSLLTIFLVKPVVARITPSSLQTVSVATAVPPTTDEATQKRITGLIAQLGDENDTVRRDAAWNLGKIADSKTAQSMGKAVQPLIRALADKSPGVRMYAAFALGKIGDLKGLQPLINALGDSDSNVRLFAANALGVLGDPQAEEPLKNLLTDKDARVRKIVAKAIKQIKSAQQVKAEKEQTTIEELAEKKKQALTPRRAKPETFVGKTAPMFKLKDLNNKQVSMSDFKGKVVLLDFWATWCGPCRRVIPHLEALHKKYKDQGLVIIGMNCERDHGKVRAFAKEQMSYAVLLDADEEFKKYSIRAIPTAFYIDRDGKIRYREVGYGPGAEREVERKVNELLTIKEGVTAYASELDRLIDQLKHNDSRTRARAASALGRLGDKRAFKPLLIVALKDKDTEVRRMATSALGMLGDKRAVEPLITALKDEDHEVGYGPGAEREVERKVNGLHTVREGVTADAGELYRLIDQLKRNSSRARARAASALGRLGDKRAVKPLITALKDNDASVRQSAAEALAELDWQPANDLQRAYYFVALQKWTEAVKLGPSAVEAFLVALKAPAGSKNVRVHSAARMAFAKIGPEAVDPAIAVLKDKDTRLHYSAVVALRILGDKRAVEPLITTLKHDDSIVRSESATILGELGDKRAVEPLIAAMKDKDGGVRRFAARALGRLGDKRAFEPLITTIKDEDRWVRSFSARALGQLGDERAVEPLTVAMKDEDRYVRESVGYALRRLVDKGSTEHLVALLEDTDMRVRALAAETLARMGDKRAFEPLIVVLKDEDTEVRRMAASALGGLGDKRAVESLIRALGDENRGVRWAAAGALGSLGDKRAVEPLIVALKDKDAWVRGSVAGALGQLEDERAVEPLLEALRYDDDKVLSAAALALAQLLGDERAVEPLLAAISRPDSEWVGMGVLVMLERIGPPAVEPLIAALQHEDKGIRYTAVHVLVRLDDKRAVEPVVMFLKSESDELREPGTEGTMPSTVEYLIELLKHKEMFYVRSSSAWALGWLGDKRAVEPLVAALGDAGVMGNPWAARVQVAIALGRLGDKRAVEPLIDILKRITPLKNEDSAVFGKLPGQAQSLRRSAAKTLDALVKIGPQAVEPLIGVLKDENAFVRSFAAKGLGELDDKRAVEALVAVLKDEDEEVRRSTTEALRKLGWQPGTDVE